MEVICPALRGLPDTNDPGNYWLYHDNLIIPQQRNSHYRLVLYRRNNSQVSLLFQRTASIEL